ncbi:MAG: rubrerythrin family protein [Methanohalobium sp.]|uniref:rubrerythrin family protein n=1 Tax=Methanohalobium sp. TaxID=2837493 RepID=UPI003978B163
MSTIDNLKDAFSGESMANRKYLAFAEKADKDGYKQIAKLFRAAAAAETVHAHNHLDILGEVKSTDENLQEAIKGETFEFEQMYPGYIKEANEEEHTKAAWSFDVANKVEKIHADLYQKALDNMGSNEDVDYYVCQVCGNTVENEAPDVCPICGAPKSKFEKVE